MKQGHFLCVRHVWYPWWRIDENYTVARERAKKKGDVVEDTNKQTPKASKTTEERLS
jgi:hypothetical protein